MMVGLPLNTGLGKDLGKKGTSTDITLYNRKSGDVILNVVEASSFPDKFRSMLLTVSMSDYIVLHASSLGSNFAEVVLACDAFGKSKGMVYLEGVIREQVAPLVKGTVVEGYDFFEGSRADLLSRILSVSLSHDSSGPTRVVVDQSFQVKSVGTVVLGAVVSGELKKYDQVDAWPSGKKVTVKSIQMMDEDQEKAVAGDRVGLSVKGVAPDDVSRGTVLGNAFVVDRLDSGVVFNSYSNDISTQAMCVAGMDYTTLSIEGAGVVFGKKVALWPGQRVLVYDPSKKPVVRGYVKVNK